MDVGKSDIYSTYDNEDLVLPPTLPQFKGGYYLCVYPIGVSNEIKSASGQTYILPDTEQHNIDKLLTVGLVVSAGPLAYKTSKFLDPDTGKYLPLCEVGDLVIFSRFGHFTAVIHQGKKFYILPDDAVLYTVDSPSEIDPRYNFKTEDIEKVRKELAERKNK